MKRTAAAIAVGLAGLAAVMSALSGSAHAFAAGTDAAPSQRPVYYVQVKAYPGELRCDGDSAKLALRITLADGTPAAGVPVGVWLWNGTIRIPRQGSALYQAVAYSNSAGIVEAFLTPRETDYPWYDWEYRVGETDIHDSVGPYKRGACPMGPSYVSVVGRVWLDTNADGFIQSWERALPRSRLLLSGTNSSSRYLRIPGRSVTTDAGGNFTSPLLPSYFETWLLCIEDSHYRIVSVVGAVQVSATCVTLDIPAPPFGKYTLNIGVARTN